VNARATELTRRKDAAARTITRPRRADRRPELDERVPDHPRSSGSTAAGVRSITEGSSRYAARRTASPRAECTREGSMHSSAIAPETPAGHTTTIRAVGAISRAVRTAVTLIFASRTIAVG
jgi:hypothetical protein